MINGEPYGHRYGLKSIVDMCLLAISMIIVLSVIVAIPTLHHENMAYKKYQHGYDPVI